MNMSAVTGIAFAILASTPTLTAGECSCTEVEQIFDFVTVDITDMPWKNEFPWKFVSCEGDQVTIELVFEDNPLLDSYSMEADGNQPIFYHGAWTPFKDFVQLVEPECHSLTS